MQSLKSLLGDLSAKYQYHQQLKLNELLSNLCYNLLKDLES
jgi:hypothetical protein